MTEQMKNAITAFTTELEKSEELAAYKAAKAGKANYTPKAFYRFYRILAKLLPVRLVMKMAKT